MPYRPEFPKRLHLPSWLILGCLLLVAVGSASAQAQFADEFSESSLDPSWTFWDGYAVQFPSETSNHATSDLTGSQLRISIPAGSEHNMWYVRQAQVTRVFDGDGVYETKMDTPIDGSKQFGLVFQSSPGTFLIFMLYGTDKIQAYVERFVNFNGEIFKSTFPGPGIGPVLLPIGPDSGPFYVRVIVDDDPDPSQRQWFFEWSQNGGDWSRIIEGGFESASEIANIGAVQDVGVFAGNNPDVNGNPVFEAFSARFDYFRRFLSVSDRPLVAPGSITALPGDGHVDLTWSPVENADSYAISRGTTAGGPYSVLATVPHDAFENPVGPEAPPQEYSDLSVTNGTKYHYRAKAVRSGSEGPASREVSATPNAGEIPRTGLVLALRASELAGDLSNGDPVTQWSSVGGVGVSASASGATAPTFVASGIGGQPVVRFDGANDFMTLSSGLSDFRAGLSLYVVMRPTVLQFGFKLLMLGNGANQQNIGFGRAGDSFGYQYFSNSSSGAVDSFSTSSGLLAGEAALISVLQGAGALNGTSFAELAKNGESLGGKSLWVPALSTRSSSLVGKSYFGADGLFQGDVAEILLYNRALTLAEQATIRTYVAQTYGLSIGGPQPVVVPNVVGLTQAAAETAIPGANLQVGSIGQQSSETVPAGSVISQTPLAGAMVVAGSVVNLVVSTGPAPLPVNVPSVVGLTQTAAETALSSVGLAVGTVAGQSSETVAAGLVISQSPTAGALASSGTLVNLVISTGPPPAPVEVPDVVGLTQSAAQASLTSAGLLLGAVTQQPSETVPAGEVLSQSPVAGTSVAVGTAVSLVVSSGPPITEIPTDGLVIALRANGLVGSLADGEPVTQWFSEEGSGGTAVASGAQAPTFTVSAINGQPAVRFDGVDDFLALTGSLRDFRAGVSLYVVMRPTVLQNGFKVLLLGNGAGAQNIGLGRAGADPGYQYFTFSDSGAVGFFNTSGGLVANEAALVSVLQAAGVSNGTSAAELAGNGSVLGGGDVAVPALADRLDNLIGKSRFGGDGLFQGDIAEILLYNRALSAAEQATVRAYIAQKYSLSIAGPQPVPVPNVVGEAQATAAASIVAAGLVVGTVTTAYDANVPAGSVISQNPSGGTSALPGTAVTLVVSLGVQPVTVPTVVGEAQATAAASIVAAGLVVGTVTTAYDANVPAGSVISQNPSGGTSALPGTAVTLVVSLGVQPVTVPTVVGEAQATAAASIVAAGLVVGTVTTAYDANVPAGSVISQNPSGGTSALPGTAVTLVVSLGVQPVTVPTVVGEAQATAAASIVAAGLVVGTVTTAYDANVPAGSVISQNPSGGTSALPGTAVTLVVSLGVQPVTVPTVVGEAQATAAASIVAAGLVVGTVTTAYDANVPAGSVISQNPSGGTSALPGTAVTLVVSLGVQPVTVPTVVGEAQATAAASIVAAGLVVGTVTTAYDANVPAGSVISQNPSGGTSALPGTAVTLVVSLGVQPVTVPTVVGEAQATAAASIVAAGLVVGTVTTAYDANVPAGSVISQNPSGGTSALPGTAVTLVVSLGVQPVTVPTVVGEAQATAAASIVAAGLVVGTVTTAYDANVPAGSVISQNPSGGTSALPGTAVTLVVSLGVQPVTVPTVVGEAQATAAASIVAAGLVVGTVTTAYDANVPAGSVISQNPSGGTSALPGTAVTLVVSLGVQPVTVPTVVGEAQATAAASIVAAGLVVGTVTTAYDANVPAGSVISQNPSGGTSALPGTAVTLVVSLGVQPVTVPTVVGEAQATAAASIVAAGLVVGTVTTAYDANVPAGSVISQNPSGGTSALPGTAVTLVVSLGVQPVTVPTVVGEAQATAAASIVAAGLVVGTVTTAYDANVPAGSVISQNPSGGTSALPGTAVTLVVSLGVQPVTVPTVVGEAQATAAASIVAAGLVVGTVTTAYDANVPAGSVISQNPSGGTSALPGTAVTLVVSLGVQPVTVPTVVGEAQATAAASIVAAGLVVGTVTTAYDANVPAGSVISQNPSGGTSALPGTAVTLVVSLGVQPVTVPTVVGEAQATAAASIVAAGLVVGTVTTAYDANVPAGSVISQNPSGGTSALPGTAVTLVVSLGVQPVTVPTVVGEAQATAAASIVAAGLVVGTVTTAYDANVPAGSVISQNPSGGTSALPGTAVTLVVSLGVQPVTVPTVVGEAQATAAASIVAAGLVVGTVTTAYDANVPAGSVISQNPSGGTSALPGTAVTLVVSLGVQPVTVPTVVGEAQATAAASIVAAGLVVGTVTTAYDANVPAGSVISQNPSGGTSALPGTAVTLVVSLGVQPVTVPTVVGEAQATAAASIVAAGLVVGTVTTAYDANVPAGSVISQNPSGGTSALPGTAVTLVVSLGVQPVTVPNVVGEAQATAAASIVAAGLVVGTVTTAYDANVPAGSVISQNPSGGTSALPGTAVTLVVSLGVQPVTVPTVVGEAQATAAASIVAAGLVVGTVTTAYDANVPAGSVISQNPSGGTSALPGTAVTLVVSLGVQPVTVPTVVGEAQATAAASIVAAGLVVGTVTTAYDANVPAGSVISQNPSGGTSALPGTAVTLVVSLGVQPVTVPTVVGEAQATAAASIVAAGLVVGTVTTAYDANVPAGSVISQNPSGGTSALPGTAVTLVVSLGVQPVTVPTVVGEAQATAAASIVAAGLVVGTVTTAYDANVPAGSVISQNPSGGTSALPGTAVTLVVSLGVQPVTVPTVVGEAQATAAASIVAAGLVVGTVTTAYDANVPAGSVISRTRAVARVRCRGRR